MRQPARRRLRRGVSVPLIAMLLVPTSGCATLRATIGAYDVGPNGIAWPQQHLRDALVNAEFGAALDWKEDDALLRALDVGISSYYASQFARSAALLDSAAQIADDRITASLTKDALALFTSDLARPYQARRTERLFVPYYGMLAYARLEQWEAAAVEARRLNALLAQYAPDRASSEAGTHGAMHYLAGAVLERAGEREDAHVAYRLARSMVPGLSDVRRSGAGNGDGELLVVVERGFVAHRATESINVSIGESERDSLRQGDRDGGMRAVSRIAEQLARAPNDDSGGRRRSDRHGDGDDGYWLSVALPSVRRSPRAVGDASLLVDGEAMTGTRVSTVIDDATVEDARRERVAVLTRAVARAAMKYVVTKAVKDKQGEMAGDITNIGASLLDRADVRSWHLLPQEITLLRVRVPAGERTVQVAVNGALDGHADPMPVNVRAGQLTIAAVRMWREAAPHVLARR